jgi:DnaJ-class molecular chaperone
VIISPNKAIEAADILDVTLATLTADELSRAYRDKAKEHHPDKLGPDTPASHEWARISWAKECLGHWLRHRPTPPPDGLVEHGPTCQACGGSGRIKVAGRRFGTPLTIMCSTCRGDGTLEPLENDHD